MASHAVASPKEPMIGGLPKWDVERAAETLIRAEEIKLDEKLHDAAKIVVNKKFMATQQAKLDAMKKVGK